MGREIEKVAHARGHQVIARLDTPEDWHSNREIISKADMVIEFSTPASAVDNIRRCFDLHLPVVVGTTGWNEKSGLVRQWCETEKMSIFTASNFSIGVNILYSLTRKLSEMINMFDDYEISLEEIHHIHKLDSPSGTAINMANIIIQNLDRKKRWVNHSQENPEELEILSAREDEIPGIHIIHCESGHDRLSLRHEAKSRTGFAVGALLAAEWLKGKQGFFEMKDFLHLAE